MFRRNKKKIIAFSFIFISSLLIHYFIFYKHIKIYQPVAITINNIPFPKNVSLRITGITTFDKIYIFLYDEENKKWEHGYSFIKSIDIEMDSSYINETFELTIAIGKERTTYNKDSFNKEWKLLKSNNGIQTYKLPEKFSSMSFWGSYFSIFMWKTSQMILLGCSVLFLFFLSVINFKRILTKIRLLNRKWLILTSFGYGALIFIFLREFYRHNNNRLDGISMGSAIIFIVFVFFLIHLISEFIFIWFKINIGFRKKVRWLYISILIILLCIELLLRVFNVNATYSERVFNEYSSSNYKPSGNYYQLNKNDKVRVVPKNEFTYKRTFNSDGLADVEHYVEKEAGVIRIMAIGDSFTEGIGADFDSTWVSLLSHKIVKQNPADKFEFFNAGIADSDPFYGYMLLKDKLLKYKPDMVLLSINTTDVSDYIFRGGFARFLPDSTIRYSQPPSWENYYAYSYIFRLFVHNLMGYDFHFLRGKDKTTRINEAINALHNAAIKFNYLCQDNNFTLVTIVHPQLNETIKGQYFYDSFAPAFENDNRLNVVNVLSFFKSKNITSKENAYQYYWKTDQHHNAKGYSLFADAVFEFLNNKHFFNETPKNEINLVNPRKKK